MSQTSGLCSARLFIEFAKQNLSSYNFKRFLRVLGTSYPEQSLSQKVLDCLIIFSLSTKRTELLDGFQSFLPYADQNLIQEIRIDFLGLTSKENIAAKALCSLNC
jgi:hypothetical protein